MLHVYIGYCTAYIYIYIYMPVVNLLLDYMENIMLFKTHTVCMWG